MEKSSEGMNPYFKYGLMLLTSFVMMYAIMYLNVDVTDHIYLAPTRTYMTFLMVAPMAASMMLFMWKMYPNKLLNYAILGLAMATFILSFLGLRQQVFIGDVQWMKAMIPHHSSAIMVSQKANLRDPEAIQLAKDIIELQKEEIAQMKRMIERLEE